MNRKLLSALILSSMLTMPATVLGAEANTVTITQEEQQQISKTIANLEQEIKALRERVGKVETAKTAVKAPATSDLKFSGDSRLRWFTDRGADTPKEQQRIRLSMKKDVSKDISFYGRLMLLDNNPIGSTTKDRLQLVDGNFTHKGLFGTNQVTIGRFSQDFLATTYWAATTGRVDGLKVGIGNELKVNVGYANWAPTTTTAGKDAVYNYDAAGKRIGIKTYPTADKVSIGTTWFIDAEYEASKATTITGMWLKEKNDKMALDQTSPYPFDVRGIGFKTKLDNDFSLLADFTKNYANTQGLGKYISLRYKEANKAVVGSYGLRLDYRKVELNNNVSAITGVAIPVADSQGPAFGVNYAPAKNLIVSGYQTFASKKASTGANVPNYSRIEAVYSF